MPNPSYAAIDLLPTTPLTAVGGGTGLDPMELVEIVFALSRAYHFQKGTTPRVYNGTTLNTVSGLPPASFSVVANGTGVTASTLYTAVYLDPLDEEFCTTAPYADLTSDVLFASITLANQGADCVIPDPPAGMPRLTRARVFRALDGTADMRQLTGTGSYSDITVTPGGGANHTFSDTGSVSEATLATRDPLNLAKRYYTEGTVPASWTGEFFGGRMWIVNPTKPNEALFSESNLPEDFPTANVVTVLPSAEDPNPYIMAFRANNGQLWAYTKRGGYLISGGTPPFKVTPFFRGVGTQSTKGAVYMDGAGVIFPSEDGFYVHAGGSEVSILGVSSKWPGMNPIDDLYQAMDKGRMNGIVGVIDRPHNILSFACPLANGDGVNTGGFDWAIPRSDWSKFSGRVVTVYGQWMNPQGRPWTVFGDELGGVWQAYMGNYEGVALANLVPLTADDVRPYLDIGTGYSATTVSVAGSPLFVVNTTTNEVAEQNRILSYTPTGDGRVQYLYPLSSIPSYGGAYSLHIGPIYGIWQSGWFEPLRNHLTGVLHYIDIYLRKDAGGTIRALAGMNQNAALIAASNSISVAQDMDHLAINDRGNRMQVRFEGIAPGTDWAIAGWATEITATKHRR